MIGDSNVYYFTGFYNTYDAGLFTPLEDFRSFSDTEFSTFGHPAFPWHSVRIKKNFKDFCDSTVRFVAFTIYEYFSLRGECNTYLTIINFKADTRDTLTLKLGTFSSISLRVGITPTKTTLYFGPTEVSPFIPLPISLIDFNGLHRPRLFVLTGSLHGTWAMQNKQHQWYTLSS